MENKTARIPVASHGLHKHSYNYPWLSSINFGDVMPCYINPIRKGESDSPKAGMFSQLMPIAHNAFATGRFNFKAIFVPYKLVWRPWYYFDQQTEMVSDGEPFTPSRYPYVSNNELVKQLMNVGAVADGDENDYDVLVYNPATEPGTKTYYHLNLRGRRLFRIIGALGCMPSFDESDERPINILALLCYCKAFADYYFPNNYVGNTDYRQIANLFERDIVNYNPWALNLVNALVVCSCNYYENSIFDLAWDNPVTPNVASSSPNISISDVTDPDPNVSAHVGNSNLSNGTPDLIISDYNSFTQYILNVLKSVSMWAKRRQLSGARLLDRFLVSRGVTLNNDSARISYFLGSRNIEIDVSAVENTTDVNLGELAGRGVASSGNQPLSFECKPDDDGIFFVIVSPLPDANFPVLLDGYSLRQDFLDNYTAEYDKLGSAAIPRAVINNDLNGENSQFYDPDHDGVFGFLNQYWDEVQERPRLLGDFILRSKGAVELSAYHTFRMFQSRSIGKVHSYDFVRMEDNFQYQRLFYSSDQENLMLFLRWYGSQYKEKLPLGDSYDWDDDDLNRKVSVVTGGSQK